MAALSTKVKLLNAALGTMRAKGYSATSVDDLCVQAGVTKGAFFHHFKTKEDLGVEAASYWSATTSWFFAAAPYQTIVDPFERLLGYVDFRKEILRGALPEFTCFVGTMVQETFETHPTLREACGHSIRAHAESLEPMIEAAVKSRNLTPDWTARSLALHTQAVIQGAFILAKASNSADLAIESVTHLRRYLVLLFQPQP